MRRALVLLKDRPAGWLEETADGYRYTYDRDFLKDGESIAVSLPLCEESFESKDLFPFFLGLLPEGWYREIVCLTLKIDPSDSFALLLGGCEDCVGAVSIRTEDQAAP